MNKRGWGAVGAFVLIAGIAVFVSNHLLPKRELSPPAKTGWQYDIQTDEMRKTTVALANLESVNSVELSAPYQGGTKINIVLRERGDELSAMLRINRGQFSCHRGGKDISVKFGDEPIEQFSCGTDADGNSVLIFIKEAEKFTLGLRRSRTAIVEVALFQEGERQFKFEIPRLSWPVTATEAFEFLHGKPSYKRSTTQPSGESANWTFTPTLVMQQGGELYLFSSSEAEINCHACSGLVEMDYIKVAEDGSLHPVRSWRDFDHESGSWGQPVNISIHPKSGSTPALLQKDMGYTAQGYTSSVIERFRITPAGALKVFEKSECSDPDGKVTPNSRC